ncbi:SDR family NAD(P)-dependent oxidoreductase [Candidatus Enterococcus ikei]|uniref:SDR family NAD(P)-dependent oxidoreductase n=1 Tax=Candidatus Enterococcus ikei TaxID=2815326 RepID=A0ABS3GXV2_9ENTE|nr:SDR family NAD(P)-dependent oxidoreductase [Enterococcus sp. DIV0869a]MBO0440102.1 SDR family NAD(P)-dependent oxidoreductase [Enterococcus sp. DIV0869a]
MKYTVITGASSGIGLETAKEFGNLGKNLILVARREDRLDRLKKEILSKHPTLEILTKTVDLSQSKNVLALYNSLKGYDIETWINNAGFGYYHSVADQDLEKVSQMLHLNIEALTLLSSLYVTDYQDKENAQLINISSAGGYRNVSNAATYCATKFYVSAFTEAIALELQAKKASLKAKILAPAATETEFAQVANGSKSYDYTKGFTTFHTAKEMAQLLIDLYQSQEVVGLVDRETFEFNLSGPIFDHYQTGIINL